MTTSFTLSTPVMPAEWEPQDAIMLAWPHRDTDWCYMLKEAQACFKEVARSIIREMRLIVIAPDVDDVKRQLRDLDHNERIVYQEIATNDTWARDFGPISIIDGDKRLVLDFKFNAWGLKFAACHDNLICMKMQENGIFNAQTINCQDFVLEGGSIESDGMGTILTTSQCLLSPNRNRHLNKLQIEDVLKARLGAKKVLWLDSGELTGDDTDAHIDTLARLVPGNTILYVKSDDPSDKQYASLQRMEHELKSMTNAHGEPFRLVPLPCPAPVHDEEGNRLPATYANFLITNSQVLVPIYNQPETDKLALDTIAQAFPGRNVVGIDCNALIQQHGSLHCVTMQIPKNFLKES
ncbi:MAG: agmatine deiminase family protein [Muribaculaceae bacterium]|nr:agmatine deiminase family protein [Muribaculaceae bacterium]